MPDSTTIPLAEGGAQPQHKTNWLMLGGMAVIGVVLLVYMLQKAGGSTSSNATTTSAGTSINAALGSIQEENLNLMGQMSQGFQNTNTNMSSGFAQISSQMTQFEADISNQLDAVNQGVVSNGQGIAGLNTALGNYFNQLSGQMTASTQQENQYYQALQGAIGNVASLSQTQQAQLLADLGGIAANLQTGFQAQNNAQGTALDWLNEIKARLQQGDYSAPTWGPSGQSWSKASTPYQW